MTTIDPITEATCTLCVEGMSCGGCARGVERAARPVDGVTDASVDLAHGRATVRFDPSHARVEQIVAAIAAVGYRSRPESVEQGATS